MQSISLDLSHYAGYLWVTSHPLFFSDLPAIKEISPHREGEKQKPWSLNEKFVRNNNNNNKKIFLKNRFSTLEDVSWSLTVIWWMNLDPLPFTLIDPCHPMLYRPVFLISPAHGDRCLPFWLAAYIFMPNCKF